MVGDLMQVTAERLSPVSVQLNIDVPAEAVKLEFERAYTSVQKSAKVKGFRPGKAPRDILRAVYGDRILSDVMNTLVQSTLPQALAKENLSPVNQPSVEPTSAPTTTSTFSYKATFEVQPEVKDVNFEGFTVKKPWIGADDETVNTELENLRKAFATFEDVATPRAAKETDLVSIDFDLTVDGKEVKDGGGKAVQLELGSGQLLPELDKALTGAKPGETVTAESKFHDKHPREDFRGKTGVFTITLVSLKEKKLPELDDAFAKQVGRFETLVELRADMHSRLEKASKDQSELAVAEQIIDQLNAKNPLEVPPSLVLTQRQMMERDVIGRARRAGQMFTDEQAQELFARIATDAEKKVRAGLLMAGIARKLELKVTDEDLAKAQNDIAAEQGKSLAKVKAEYATGQQREMLVGMVLEDKILSLIEPKATVTELKKGETWAAS